MEYIRKTYGVPAKRGARIRYTWRDGLVRLGTIKSASGQYLSVQMDETPNIRRIFHPTWNIEYLESDD